MAIINRLAGILRRNLPHHPHSSRALTCSQVQLRSTTTGFLAVTQLANYHQFKLVAINYSTMPAEAKNGTTAAPVPFQRLPDHVVPLNYALTFEPDWTSHTFKATALIDVLVKEPTDCVTLNASEFQVNQVTYSSASCEGRLIPDLFFLVKDQELLKINFSSALPKGPGQLCVEYSGKVADNLKGFFKSKYTGPNGEDRWHFLTKFEPTFARGCFPCWDEPAIKATYDITLIVPKDLVAVSNMPVKSDNPHPDNPTKKVVTFHRSVKMSTYVMAFAIGEFDYVEHLAPGVGGPAGILCRVYTPVGKKDRGSFALDVVVKSLQFYERYFGIPYPLPKMDLLGVTEFGSGAMENWGLVIFREQNLLMDDKQSSALTKQYVSIVVAHETAHMWFGNLVTMEWWSDLWLNEGFATWMEYLCVDCVYPELQIWNLYMSDFIHCLELDSSSISHPIQVDVRDPAEIGAIFDTISYRKGAAVIRMLHAYLGDSEFKEGLKRYLEGHLFGNAETKDLWAALKEKSGKEVGLIMGTWTEQMGYPLVTVTNVRRDKQDVLIKLKYEKFSWPGGEEKQGKDNMEKDNKAYRWIIPVTVRRQGGPRGEKCLSVLIDKEAGEEAEIRVEGVGEGEWVKLNADHVGYYRVAYQEGNLMDKFEMAIRQKEMEPLDRLGILDDLFAGAKAGKGKTEDVLRFVEAYKNEDQYSVWSCVLSVLGDVGKLVRGSHLEEGFRKFASGILEPIYGKLGWDKKEDEKPQDSVLRTAVLNRMVSLGHPLILEDAGMRFRRHLKGEMELSPDVRSAVYRAVMKGNPEEGFEQLLGVYRKTDLLEERVRILGAFGAVGGGSGATVEAVVEKILEFGRGKEVNKQDIITILVSLSEQGGMERGWQYFTQNWEFFRDNFPTGHFLIRHCVEGVAGGFKTEEKALEVEQFFREHHLKGVERSVKQALEKIRIAKDWMERDAAGLQSFLEKYL